MPQDFDPIDSFFKGIADQNAQTVGGTLPLHQQDPREVAGHAALARELGVPLRLVEADPDGFRQRLDQRKFQEALREAPLTSQWLQDQDNARIARGQMDNLTWWERNGAVFEQGEARAVASSQRISREAAGALETSLLGRGINRLQSAADETLFVNEDGSPNLLGRMANALRGDDATPVGQPTPTPQERRDQIVGNVSPMERGARQRLQELEQQGIAPMSYDQIDGIGGAFNFVVENLMSSAPQMMASIASGAASPLITTTLMAGEVNEELIERAPDLTLDQRVAVAGTAGVAMTGLEMFGLSRIFGGLAPTDLAVEAMEGKLVQRLVNNGVAAATARTMQAAIAEGSTELLQESIIMGVTTLSGGEYTADEVKDRLINSFFAGSGVGGGLRGGQEVVSGTAGVLRDAGRWFTADQTRADLRNIDQMAATSELKELDPDRFMAMLGSVGYNDRSVTVPAQEISTFYQGEVRPEQLQQLAIQPEDFDIAMRTGGEVTIPLSNYATYVAGTDLAEIVQQHGKIDPNELSLAEADALEAGIGQDVASAIERDMQRLRDENTPTTIRDRIREQLEASGAASPRVANVQATVAGSLFEATAQRTGQTTEQLASRYGLEVRGMSDIPQDGASDMAVASDPAVGAPPPQAGDTVTIATQDYDGTAVIREMLDDGRVMVEKPDGETITASVSEIASQATNQGGPTFGRYQSQSAIPPQGPAPEAVATAATDGEPAQGDPAGTERGDARGGAGAGQLQALEGAPTVRGVSGPDPRLQSVAERYAAENGIDFRRQGEFVEVDPERAARIAEAYEQMEHAPQDPVVREAYENLIRQTVAQYEALVADGYQFYFIDLNTPEGQAYADSPWNAMFDLRDNKRMGVFSTTEGFGSNDDFSPEANPLLAQTQFEWPMGPDGEARPVYANDLFRAVHDAFGHGLEFAGFRARGEENAWQAHVRLFTGSAVAAITSETRGRNSFLNYGPHGENNRNAKVEDTIFADQKTGLMPEWTWTEGRASDADPRILNQDAAPIRENTIIGPDGQPVRLYHGTTAQFDNFSDGEIFLTNRRGLAVEHALRSGLGRGARLVEGTVALENPLEVAIPADQDPDTYYLSNTSRIEADKAAGQHDGVMIYNPNGELLVIATRNDQFDQAGRTFNQNQAQQAPRAQISIPQGGIGQGDAIIQLFETADLSSFFHEIGHYALEVWSDLEARGATELSEDLAVIRKFVGAGDGQKGFTTAQHEKFARGFEAYLMEGKAPSMELADVFRTVKAWLTRIYRNITGLDVRLNDDIRQVFDRMLATDEAIEQARAAQALRPLFADKPPSMPETDWSTYQRMARRSSEQAEQKLLSRMMEKIMRERKDWWKQEAAIVEQQVEEEIDALPEFVAINAMSDTGNDKSMRLDKQALIEMFGDDIIAQIDRTKVGGKRAIYGPDGMTPEEAADMFGFAGPVKMMEAIKAAGKRADRIATEVDRRMTEKYGDPFTDGTIEQEALDAIHSDQQAASAVQEARELVRQLGGNPKGMTSQLYRARAKDMVSRMTVAQATKPQRFLAAERKAAREAEQAFARVARGGGETALAAALQAKERQVLNQHLYTEARRIEEMVTKARTRMMDYRKKDVREKLEGSYIEQIDTLLADYDFRKRSAGDIQRAANLQRYIDEMTEAGREAELNIDMRLIENARKVPYTQLSVSELTGLLDTIANIDHMGRFKQKLIDRKRKRDLARSADRAAQAVYASQKRREPSRSPRRVLQALNLLSKPDTITIRMDGGEEFGAFYDEIKRGIDESVGVETEMQRQNAEALHDLYAKHYTKADLRSFAKKRAVAGVDHPWSKNEIIALAMNMGTASNYQRVMDQNVHATRRLDDTQLDLLLQTLEDRDWRFVQDHIDLINTLWPELAAVHKRRTGTTPEKVEAEVMYIGAPDWFRGGYYPIKYDPTLSVAAARDEETATDKYMTAGHGSTTAIGNGMTKQREKTGGGRTVLYDLSVGFNHMRETTRYVALSEAVDNAYRVLNHEAVKVAMQETGNLDTHQTLNLWLQDTAQGPIFNSDLINTAARIAKNNFTMSRLAFNMKTIILQTTGLAQSAAVIGKRNMVRGMMRYSADPRQTLADIEQISPKMRERKTTFQKDMYDWLNSTEQSKVYEGSIESGRRWLAQAGFLPIVALQFYAVDVPTWVGAYSKYIVEYDGDVERAAMAADKMVERAQDTGLTSERAAVERGTLSKSTRQADAVRIFTTLGGYMLTKINRAGVTTLQGRAAIRNADTPTGKLAAAMNMSLDLFMLFAVEAIMMGVMYELLDDDEDLDDLNAFLIKETATATVAGIPLVRDAASAFNGYGGGGVYGSVMEVPANLIAQAAQGENDRALRRSIADLIGITTGLPTTATTRAIEAILDDSIGLGAGLLGNNPLDRQ